MGGRGRGEGGGADEEKQEDEEEAAERPGSGRWIGWSGMADRHRCLFCWAEPVRRGNWIFLIRAGLI